MERNVERLSRQEHDDSFAPVVWSFVRQFKKAEGRTKSKLREGLCVTLQKWTDYPVSMISEEVARKALSLDVESPFQMLWPDKNKFGVVGRKSFLVFEHTTPIRAAAGELLECNSEQEVRDYMNVYSGVCWITREEDDRLTREGFRSIRSAGWQACYERCGIRIISAEQFESMKSGLPE